VDVEIKPLTDEFLINYYTSSLQRCHSLYDLVGSNVLLLIAQFATDLTDCTRLQEEVYFDQIQSSPRLIERFRDNQPPLISFLKGFRFSVIAHRYSQGSRLLDPISSETNLCLDPIKCLQRRVDVGMNIRQVDPLIQCRLEYETGEGNIRSDRVIFRLFMNFLMA